jgi:hypothetical protein
LRREGEQKMLYLRCNKYLLLNAFSKKFPLSFQERGPGGEFFVQAKRKYGVTHVLGLNIFVDLVYSLWFNK